jgi:glutamate 5-kinase
LIIATNTDGIYTKESLENNIPETIKTVSDLGELQKEVSGLKSSQGTGGMQSKIEAATIAKKANIETWIVNGLKENFIIDALNNKSNFTKIK